MRAGGRSAVCMVGDTDVTANKTVVGHFAQFYCSLSSDTWYSGEAMGGAVAAYWLLIVEKLANKMLYH